MNASATGYTAARGGVAGVGARGALSSADGALTGLRVHRRNTKCSATIALLAACRAWPLFSFSRGFFSFNFISLLVATSQRWLLASPADDDARGLAPHPHQGPPRPFKGPAHLRLLEKKSYIYVTPEELSAPGSYSGSPTSYSGAENTEELFGGFVLRALWGWKIPNSYQILFATRGASRVLIATRYPASPPPRSYIQVIDFVTCSCSPPCLPLHRR
eukprot:scaffold7344_cov127-Isochrysis_galbana.AAC.3